jgi:hypothetical protein
MNEKIKRLAKNVSELIRKTDSIQETYDLLVELMKKQNDYFGAMTPDNIIKLLFYIWSHKETNDSQLGDKLLNEISFAVLFTTEGNKHVAECSHCGGDGEHECGYCDGSGYIPCEKCDGSGEEECEECDGEGELEIDGQLESCDNCGGKGEYSCSDCGGSGEVSCGNCNWGKETCSECDGEGQIETDEFDYETYFIVTWSKFIKNRCEITEDDTDITMSEYDFDRLRDKYVKLSTLQSHSDLGKWVQENEMYCLYYSDSPKMYIQKPNMHLITPNYTIKSVTI